MANENYKVMCVLFAAIAVRMACCCGPVASETQSSEGALNGSSAYNSSEASEDFPQVTSTANVTQTNGNGLKPAAALTTDHSQQKGHKRKHKLKKHNGKHHHGNHNKQLRMASSVPGQNSSAVAPADNSTAPAGHAQSSPAPSPGLPPNGSLTGSSNTTKRRHSPCDLWERCPINHDANVSDWLRRLPNCPCLYPMQLDYNGTLYDQQLNKSFQWRKVSTALDKLAILRRTAAVCIRQQLTSSSTSIAAQVCCYDNMMTLITRGIGAGTPYLVSPDVSHDVHEKVDVLPLVVCLGDWTRYHALRPPNNGHGCAENPDGQEYAFQVKRAKDF